MRKPIIAGNWKMNKTLTETRNLINEIKENKLDESVEQLICVPYTSLSEAVKLVEGTNISVGAQNMHWEESGAFTGEVSGPMLKDIGVDYVILGHSERRQYFGDTDEIVNKKIDAALNYDLKPILCVGESLEEREADKHEKVVENQIKEGLKGISEDRIGNLVIAYEPVWAIGTGKTASSDDANNMCKFIRETLAKMYSEDLANKTRIQYGGSVKPATIKDLMSKEDVDGALVGGASLVAEDFVALINFK